MGKFKHDPIIVMGMHRSGTTLLSRILQKLDVHMGDDLCYKNLESFSFMRLNDQLLHMANANWHNISPMWKVLKNDDDQSIELLTAQLRKQIHERSFDNYWCESWSGSASEGIWGWKDPRNTLTLPIWRRVFPHAKIIYIVRNGIDVAWSLIKRNQKESDPRISTLLKKRLALLWNQPRSKNRQYSTDQYQLITLEEAFHLWTEYLRFADFNIREVPDEKTLQLRYEDLLTEPLPSLHLIADFVGVKTENTSLSEVAKIINNNRRFAFTTNPELRDFYRSHRENQQMVKHGYDQILNQETNPLAN